MPDVLLVELRNLEPARLEDDLEAEEDAVRKPESNLDDAPSALLVLSLVPGEVEGSSSNEEVESNSDTVELANLVEAVSADDVLKSDPAEVEVNLDWGKELNVESNWASEDLEVCLEDVVPSLEVGPEKDEVCGEVELNGEPNELEVNLELTGEDCSCTDEESNGDAAELDLNLELVEGKPFCEDEVILGTANSEAVVEPRATVLDADEE